MVASPIVECQCPHCQQEGVHPERALHRRMNVFMSRLDEAQRRWYVALESQRMGHGGDRLLAQITGMDEKTIRRGREELGAELVDHPAERVRQPGGRSSPHRKKDPPIIRALEEIVVPETAGDPMSDQKWVRSSLRTLSARLREAGHAVSPPTVGRLLKTLDDALHVNAKKVEARATHTDRDTQFGHIADQRQAFADAGLPIVSVDTKKKELIGAFKTAGRAWGKEAEAVNVHDFPSEAQGRAVPYGVYDVTHNRGAVYVGSSGDTAQFAVDALARWWETAGCATYPDAAHLLILADGGGSNGSRSHLWKQQLQERLC
ncbi:MAG: ISAzo13 family transposase, partial [Chloroflexi bacterium]|nr:ISAzo13 family transposase [Chloroflexota bacterium]